MKTNHKASDRRVRRQVARAMRELRVARGDSQTDFGRLVGLTQSQVSRIETGERTLRDVEIRRVCRALKIEAAELLGGGR